MHTWQYDEQLHFDFSSAELERCNLHYDAGDVAAAEVLLPRAKSKAKAKIKAAPTQQN